MTTTPANPFQIAGAIPQLTAWTATLTLKKPDGAGGLTPITLAEITTCTLTLYDQATSAIINTVSDVDVKNTGRGSLHATNGTLTTSFHDADNAIVTVGTSPEWHVALIECTYNGGADSLRQEIVFAVRDVIRVP